MLFSEVLSMHPNILVTQKQKDDKDSKSYKRMSMRKIQRPKLEWWGGVPKVSRPK